MIRKVESNPSFPELEQAVLARWQKEQIFQKSLKQREGCPEYIFYDGPPFPTGAPHHGTIFVSIIKDVVPRYMTMRGKYVPRQFGWDCHGLPIETAAEKKLNITDKSQIFKIGVAEFNRVCRELVSEYNSAWRTYIDRIGRWVDMDNPYRTLDLNFMESVIWAFSQAYDKGLIYKDYRVSPYCYRCETPLSISETRLDDSTRMKQDRALTVKFPVVGAANTFFLVWTTTPWTLPSNMAIAVGADIEYAQVTVAGETFIMAKAAIERYKKELGDSYQIIELLTGQQLLEKKLQYLPPFNYFYEQHKERSFRLIAGDFVTTEDGTGLVHCAPAFGEDDYWVCRRNGIGLVNPVDERGCYTDDVSHFKGRNVQEANADVIKQLKSQELVIKDATLDHNYPHCWRCREPLIYRALDAWYFKVEAIKDQLIKNNETINWFPDSVKTGRFGNWLENARDWNISRNRFWATPIPVWECNHCDSREALGSVAKIEEKSGSQVSDLHKEYLDQIEYTCACGGKMQRVPEVLDCWFESGSMPYGQWHYPFENSEHFNDHFPADFIVEYTGQIRGWFYVLHVLSTALFDKPAFRNCLVHGTLLAADGKKMSKSLKNYTDPLELVNKHSADAMRLYLLSSNSVHMQDLTFKDEGIESMVKTVLLPLWNALSFFTTYAEIDQLDIADLNFAQYRKQLSELDLFILSELEILLKTVTEKMNSYYIHEAVRLIPEFLDVLNNWYIRRSRERVWEADPRATAKMAFYVTTYRLLTRLSQIIAPIIPFIAEAVWQRLGYKDSVHLSDWPEVDESLVNNTLSQEILTTRKIISAGLAIRAREKIRVRQPLGVARVALCNNIDLSAHIEAIRQELNVKKLEFVTNPAEIADRIGKANARVLGPKYGSKVQQILQAIKTGQFSQNSDGTIAVADLTLDASDVEIGYVGKQGLAVESVDGNVVALDLNVTPELELEGLARDLVRIIQDLRKEADLQIADRIKLCITGADEILSQHAEYIKQETLTLELLAELKNELASKQLNLGNSVVIVKLVKG